MNTLVAVVLGGAVVLFGWRLASRRRSLPCPAWLGWLVEMENPFTRVNRATEIIGQLSLQPGLRVLDAGCGPGRLTLPLAEKLESGGCVTAVDAQQEMLDRVQRRAAERGLTNIEYVCSFLGRGSLQKNYYDRAVLSAVLGEIPVEKQERVFVELLEALKVGGMLLVAETIFDPHFQSKALVTSLAKKAGFEVLEARGGFACYTLLLQKN